MIGSSIHRTTSGVIDPKKVWEHPPTVESDEGDATSGDEKTVSRETPALTDCGEQSFAPTSPVSPVESATRGTLSSGGQSPELKRRTTSGSGSFGPPSAGSQQSIVSPVGEIMALKVVVIDGIRT